MIEQLSTKLQGEQHAHILALISALMPNNELTNEFASNSKRLAYKNALEMIANIFVNFLYCFLVFFICLYFRHI